jgi:hypothetical protein
MPYFGPGANTINKKPLGHKTDLKRGFFTVAIKQIPEY